MEHLNALHFAREVQPGELHVVAHVQRPSEHRTRHYTAFAGDGEEMVIDEVQRSYGEERGWGVQGSSLLGRVIMF